MALPNVKDLSSYEGFFFFHPIYNLSVMTGPPVKLRVTHTASMLGVEMTFLIADITQVNK